MILGASIHEECGIMGVWDSPSSASLVCRGLLEIQHRGQEGCGISILHPDGHLSCSKGLGLVTEVFGAGLEPNFPEQQNASPEVSDASAATANSAAEQDEVQENATVSASAAIGHVRYGTSGGRELDNVQPFLIHQRRGDFAIAHNGNIVNAEVLKDRLCDQGDVFGSSSDTEVIAHLICRARRPAVDTPALPLSEERCSVEGQAQTCRPAVDTPALPLPEERCSVEGQAQTCRPAVDAPGLEANSVDIMEEAISDAMMQLDGAASVVVLTREAMFVCRDPYGFRPLSIGRLGSGWAAASETCALVKIGATDICDVLPGEIVTFSAQGIRRRMFSSPCPDCQRDRVSPAPQSRMCAMEYIYFARPDSDIEGVNVHSFRKNSGRVLFEESPVDADMVIGVPDSGMSAATGYSEASGLPLEMGLLKNAYSRRTFIQPSQGMRDLGVMMKLTPVRSVIRGKRLIVIDDSIVRGTTSLKIVRMLRKAGASEVHMRITSPMITSPCFYGVDISSRSELLCADRDLEKARQAIEADSLAFISQEGLLRASGRRSLCFACFDRDYPTKLYSHQI